ncbi:uncharacterized protein LOC144512743 [Sander vitreus]
MEKSKEEQIEMERRRLEMERRKLGTVMGPEPEPEPGPGPGAGPSCVPIRRGRSKTRSFKGHPKAETSVDFDDSEPEPVIRRRRSKTPPPSFSRDPKAEVDQESSEVPSDQSAQQHQTHLDSIFKLLEENIKTFCEE